MTLIFRKYSDNNNLNLTGDKLTGDELNKALAAELMPDYDKIIMEKKRKSSKNLIYRNNSI